jgi:membrane protein YqaA with SNARE-associated domain
MRSYLKTTLAILPFFLAVVLSVYFFFYTTPEALLAMIGLENAYILMFSIAALGGMTTFNTVPYLSLILVLASAGVHPFFLGLSSALGVMFGDSFSYFIGHQGATIVPQQLKGIFEKIRNIAELHPRLFPVVCFLYGALSPFSNDFITIPAGMARIAYWRVMIPLALGNVVFNIAIAYLSVYAYEWVQFIF